MATTEGWDWQWRSIEVVRAVSSEGDREAKALVRVGWMPHVVWRVGVEEVEVGECC